ncbi:putative glycoside hydrolase [Gilvimarinus sp. DA14]|uniref:putative glycoside hydrolase n=1 Tax=Gilvimarinus sp. DA14 TaxID=2956798 RepID=UPI0020B8953D|nr:putative glycoside hydrolase [Gilvimarinus sp. DA14]UTF61565.1 putative glycoside hydrolase [Gilvimarinus sp. DA14]
MLRVSWLVFLLLSCSFSWAQQGPNSNFIYFTEGQTPDPWHWVLADPGNWWMPVEDDGGRSANGKVTLTSAKDKDFPGAISLKWKKSDDWGSVTLSGGMLDISKFEQAAELVIAMRVNTKVPATVNVKMACGEDCEAEVNVADNLKNMKRGQWMALPIALDCFSANGVDLSKVNWPFSIGTAGKLELDIVEISLAPMAEGEEGCVPNS